MNEVKRKRGHSNKLVNCFIYINIKDSALCMGTSLIFKYLLLTSKCFVSILKFSLQKLLAKSRSFRYIFGSLKILIRKNMRTYIDLLCKIIMFTYYFCKLVKCRTPIKLKRIHFEVFVVVKMSRIS